MHTGGKGKTIAFPGPSGPRSCAGPYPQAASPPCPRGPTHALPAFPFVLVPGRARRCGAPPTYLWHEPEWFQGVEGGFAYWTGDAKPTGHWAVAGPGISPEWTQGGESEWNSMGAPAAETRAECHRDLVAEVQLDGATVLAWAGPKTPLVARHAVGAGAVVTTLAPRMLGQDERAHPALPCLLNGLTAGLLPVEVRRADGTPPGGEVMYQVNKTKDGFLGLLVNNRGVDKTQNGVARVDRKAWADVLLRTRLPVKAAKEYTGPRDLAVAAGKDGAELRLRVHPGYVQVVYLTTGK
jgi:hypothetical protein